jgi:hypothetical protein
MPIVGMPHSKVTCPATSPGTISITSEGACLGEGPGIGEDALSGLPSALHAIATKGMLAVG